MSNDSLDGLVIENYFESPARGEVRFDSALLREPVGALPVKTALTVSAETTATEAMRRMQDEHRGCVIVTDDGTDNSKLIGIFTERDVLLRIVSWLSFKPSRLVDVLEATTPSIADSETISIISSRG